ncbi:MAG: hypothetical protein ACKVS8_11945 [Phycisphaerales bacterium]
MSRGTLLSAAVLAALAGSANAAQPDDSADHLPHRNPAIPAGMTGKPITELNSAVFAITAPNEAPGNRGNAGSAVAVGIGRFPVFPPEQLVPNPLPVNGIDIGWIAFGPAIPGDFDYQVLFFQDTIELNDVVAGTTPFYQNLVPNQGFGLAGLAPSYQFIEWFGQFLDITTPLLFDTTRSFAYEVRIFQAGSPNMWPGNAASASVIVPLIKGPVNASVGSTDVRRWNDVGVFSLDGTRPVHFTDVFPASPAQVTNRRNVYVKLQADVNVVPPPNFVDLGDDDNDTGTLPASYECTAPHADFDRVITQNAGTTSWFRVVLDKAISRDDDTYLDMRADIDLGFGLDVATSMALYNSDGQRVAFDIGEGTGCNVETDVLGLYGMLTFGTGRRPAMGGYQFDGRDGELPAGIYFVAVSGAGALYGDSLFSVNAGDSLEVGTSLMTITSNIGAVNCANPVPVQPYVRTAELVGDLTNGLTTRDVVRTGFSHVRWITCTLTAEQEITASSSTFLDVNQNGTPVTDASLGLYDDTGALVAFDRDSGQSLNATQRLGQMSFGGSASGSRPADGDGVPYTNYSGNVLAPGQYWVAIGMDSETEDEDVGHPMRFDATGWRAYHNSQSRITITVNLKTPTGCRVDYNNDGSINPDDIGDFITDYYTDPAVPGPGGYSVPCPLEAPPYDNGWKAAYNSDGSGQCSAPFPDNLGDYITDYYIGCDVPE